MRILVITRNAWDESNAIGNTLSNFFYGLEDAEFANIYFRSARPHNRVCRKYYRMSELEVLKKWFIPEKIGSEIQLEFEEKSKYDDAICKNEKRAIRLIQKYGIKLAYKVSDFIWYQEKWINRNLDEFIKSFSPDVVFSFVKAAPQYYLTIRYLREKFNLPLISWIADDEYSTFLKENRKNEIERLKYILQESSVVWGCSQEICNYYNRIFGCKATPLYKSCRISGPIKPTVGYPLLMVYAGNMLYGRADIISKIAITCDKFIKQGVDIVFEVYSNTSLLADEVQKYFGESVCVKYMGRKQYAIIQERLQQADISVFVESFEAKQVLKTKYSFSTKIVDYLQSGSLLLAVGPPDIASIKYLNSIPGVCVVDNLDNIDERLRELLSDTGDFYQRKRDIRLFSVTNHNGFLNRKKITDTIEEIIK